MIQKLKKHSALFGLVFTLSAALFTLGMTYVAYIDVRKNPLALSLYRAFNRLKLLALALYKPLNTS